MTVQPAIDEGQQTQAIPIKADDGSSRPSLSVRRSGDSDSGEYKMSGELLSHTGEQPLHVRSTNDMLAVVSDNGVYLPVRPNSYDTCLSTDIDQL